MKTQVRTQWLYAPLVMMLLITLLVLVEGRGISITMRQRSLELLPAAVSEGENLESRGYMLLYNSAEENAAPFVEVLDNTLREMHLSCTRVDLAREALPPLESFRAVYYCSMELETLRDDLDRLMTWIQGGGGLALMMRPERSEVFTLISQQLGVVELGTGITDYRSIQFAPGVLPLWGEAPYEIGDSADNAMTVRVDKTCEVLFSTADSAKIPLLWVRGIGKGRVVINNHTLNGNKDSRAIVSMSVTALEDTLAYPIVNAGMVFIDDFPAPQPEGVDERLFEQFGYNIQGFFLNHWWPDMESLHKRFGVRYSGVLVETYNDQIDPPFKQEGDYGLLRFYGAAMLRLDGEIGLHGYNHIPLCLFDFPFAGEGYSGWASEERMEEAVSELYRFGTELFPEEQYLTYVPPSNYLSDEGAKALLDVVPSLRIISGLYLNQVGVQARIQEFREERNGTVSLPRVSSGFAPDDYTRLMITKELMLHGVFSHFIHPDDVLDDERGAALGWARMYESFGELFDQLRVTYPQLRMMTSAEGAAAVQRYDRLRLRQSLSDEAMELYLDGFVDDAWVALRTRRKPKDIVGGELIEIDEGFYWIHAASPTIHISWEAAP